MKQQIINILTRSFPSLQAIYLFGSHADGTARNESDVDIAVLFPHGESKEHKDLSFSKTRVQLEIELKKDVDLVNIREVSTVFQKEILKGEQRIYCSDEYEADSFEMLTLSYYGKLNEERKDIINERYSHQ